MNLWAMVSKSSTAELEARNLLLRCGFTEVLRTKDTGKHVGTAWHNALYINFAAKEFSIGAYIPLTAGHNERVSSVTTILRETVDQYVDAAEVQYEGLRTNCNTVIANYSRQAMQREQKYLMLQLILGAVSVTCVFLIFALWVLI